MVSIFADMPVAVAFDNPDLIYVPDDYNRIQAAVNAANNRDTIIVRDGTYRENVVVDKGLTIRSENGPDSTTVRAPFSRDPVFKITSDNVVISGFTVRNSNEGMNAGIYIESDVNYCTISNNKPVNNGVGIYLYSNNKYNQITDNILEDNNLGIYLVSSNDNTITNNKDTDNNVGIYLDYSSNYNEITNSEFSNSNIGIYIDSESNYNMIERNIAFSNDNYGILIETESSYNTVINNNLSDNNFGISLANSKENTIYNNYFDNINNALDNENNIWNITKTEGTNIIGGPYLGGNFWSDYAGYDNDLDGLGSVSLPYNSSGNIQNGGDFLPLVPVSVPPKITSYTPDSPVNDAEGASRTFNVTIDQIVNVIWLIDGINVQGDTEVSEASYTATNAQIGTYNVSAKVRNENGPDMHTWEWIVTEDNEPPIINPIPSDNPHFNENMPIIGANYSDASGINEASVTLYVDGEDVTRDAEITSTYVKYTPIEPLEDGLHEASINVEDTSPNQNSNSFSWNFIVDRMPPETNFTSAPSDTINYDDVTIEWIGSDDYTSNDKFLYAYKLGGSWSDWTPDKSKSYKDLSNGDYTFSVKAKDLAGNVDETPAKISFKVSAPTTPITGVGGGGGSGGIRLYEIKTNPRGTVLSEFFEESSDGKAEILIPVGTIALDGDGNPLKEIDIVAMAFGGTIKSAYDIKPDGATFDPSVELIIKYNSSEVENRDIKIKSYRNGNWTSLETTVDPLKRTAVAKVDHFTIFALFAEQKGSTTVVNESISEIPVSTPEPTPKQEQEQEQEQEQAYALPNVREIQPPTLSWILISEIIIVLAIIAGLITYIIERRREY